MAGWFVKSLGAKLEAISCNFGCSNVGGWTFTTTELLASSFEPRAPISLNDSVEGTEILRIQSKPFRVTYFPSSGSTSRSLSDLLLLNDANSSSSNSADCLADNFEKSTALPTDDDDDNDDDDDDDSHRWLPLDSDVEAPDANPRRANLEASPHLKDADGLHETICAQNLDNRRNRRPPRNVWARLGGLLKAAKR
eukprot:CCRYP_000039-RA/>CCRYP_000039-RA protein AED:0.45 eAED:1.00 QI:0/0/0/1/0/0/4/0/194